tara:strand:- start:1084 stop:1431 length:348 start_codon:yes stop_codon:yes gene_type:complete
MATLTAQQITQSGLKPVYAAADVAGDLVLNTGIQYFHIKNESGVSVTSTVTPVITTVVDPSLGILVKETPTLILAAGEEGFLGPFETEAFNNSTTGTIEIEYTAVASVTVAALYI